MKTTRGAQRKNASKLSIDVLNKSSEMRAPLTMRTMEKSKLTSTNEGKSSQVNITTAAGSVNEQSSSQRFNFSKRLESPKSSEISKYFTASASVRGSNAGNKILHEQKFSAAGRVSNHKAPMGYKNSYWYNSPQIKTNENFNFWHDIKANVATRTKWEDNNLNNGESPRNASILINPKPQIGFDFKQSIKRGSSETRSFNSQTSRQQHNPINKHAARFLYSQIDLGSDDDDSRGASPASNFSKSRGPSQTKLLYEGDNPNLQNCFSQGKLNSSTNQQQQRAQQNGVDMSVQRRIDGRLKWFTSQISDLPGPKAEVLHNVAQTYKKEQSEASKLQNEKNILKNKISLGSYYQESKYLEGYKPSRAFKTYVKDVKTEWHRKPTNEHSVIQRNMQLYRKTQLF